MANKIIVLVVPPDDRDQGEVNVLDSRDEAERQIERLILSNIPRDQIKVFSCQEVLFSVTYQPLVALNDSVDEVAESGHAEMGNSYGNAWGEASPAPQASQNQPWSNDYRD